MKVLVFPRYARREPSRLRAFSKAEALVGMLSEARNASRRLTTAAFLSATETLRAADVLELKYGEADAAAIALLRLAEKTPKPPEP